MADIGDGYGSEWHLRDYRRHHVGALDQAVMAATGGSSIEWVDPVGVRPDGRTVEWKGLAFCDDEATASAWNAFWPATGNAMNWDAVGRLTDGDTVKWLLVEAKAHIGELRSSCGAKQHGGLPLIQRSLDSVKKALGVDDDRNWLEGYYQYCNRVAALQFLRDHDVPAELVFVYFVGDESASGRDCPTDQAGWADALSEQDEHVGIPKDSPIRQHIHSVFLRTRSSAPG